MTHQMGIQLSGADQRSQLLRVDSNLGASQSFDECWVKMTISNPSEPIDISIRGTSDGSA